MIYLDDLAVWVKTQQGSIVRGVICGIIGVLSAVMLFSVFNSAKSLDAQLAEQAEEIKFLNNEASRKQGEIEGFGSQELLVRSSMVEPGWAVAKLQTEYGNFDKHSDVNAIQAKVNSIQNDLKQYIKPGDSYDDWFVFKIGHYLWSLLTTDNYVINDKAYLDGLFECSNPSIQDTVYAVTTCKYDFNNNMFYDIKTYVTNPGYEFVKTGGTVGDSGKLFNFMTNDEYYAAYISDRGMAPLPEQDSTAEGEISSEEGTVEGTQPDEGAQESGGDALTDLITSQEQQASGTGEQTAGEQTSESVDNPEAEVQQQDQSLSGDALLDAVLTQ